MVQATAQAATAQAPPRRLLVRGVNWLGDAVMSLPALHRLREALPGARISLLTREHLADLWQNSSLVDEVIPFQKSGGLLGVAWRLRERQFDTAVILPNSARSALEARLAGIPVRIGWARPGRSWLLTKAVPPRSAEIRMKKRSFRDIRRCLEGLAPISPPLPSSAHHLHHYLHLVATLGADPEPVRPAIEIADEELAALRRRFADPSAAGLSVPLFGLNPGAEYGPAKRWPPDRFVASAVELQRRTQCHWWILGGPAEQALASCLAAEIVKAGAGPSGAVQCLAGRTTLRELCVALKACRVVLTNDTGPMHVAAAVGTPVVAIFGSTCPELTGPGLPADPRHRLLRSPPPCAPCYRRRCPVDFRCMTAIAVERVVEAMLEASASA
jgi:heptosyltransferase II